MDYDSYKGKLKLYRILNPELNKATDNDHCSICKATHENNCKTIPKKLREDIITGEIIEIDGYKYRDYADKYRCVKWIRNT